MGIKRVEARDGNFVRGHVDSNSVHVFGPCILVRHAASACLGQCVWSRDHEQPGRSGMDRLRPRPPRRHDAGTQLRPRPHINFNPVIRRPRSHTLSFLGFSCRLNPRRPQLTPRVLRAPCLLLAHTPCLAAVVEVEAVLAVGAAALVEAARPQASPAGTLRQTCSSTTSPRTPIPYAIPFLLSPSC